VPRARTELQALLPHRGAMCLLDSVEAHDGAHGALAGGAGATPGRLVAVRDVRLHAEWLDDFAEDLEIAATRLAAGPAGLVYAFVVQAGGRALAEGRATVMLGIGAGAS